MTLYIYKGDKTKVYFCIHTEFFLMNSVLRFYTLLFWNLSPSLLLNNSLFCLRYIFERDGKICTLRIKECRPDDECEYACGVEEKKSRARLFVEGEILSVASKSFQ